MKKRVLKKTLCAVIATTVCLTAIPEIAFAVDTECKEAKDGKHVPNPDRKETSKRATCTEDGEWLIYCDLCDNPCMTEVIPATGHQWADKKEIKKAGCVTDGEIQYTCKVCNEIKKETIPATGHTVVKDKKVEPACTKSGLTEGRHCSVCKEVLTEQKKIPATGHTVVKDKKVEATCTKSGLTEGRHCSVCHKVLVAQKSIQKTGHQLEKKEAIPATCTESGWTEEIFCSACNKVIKKRVRIIQRCHVPVWLQRIEPTCTKSGLTEGEYCSVCNEALMGQEAIPATGHRVVTDKRVEPTCTENGMTEGAHCSVCNEVLKEQETIAALGHEYETSISMNKNSVNMVEVCRRCSKQKGNKSNLEPISTEQKNIAFQDENGKDISSLAENLKLYVGQEEDNRRNVLYVNEAEENQLRDFSVASGREQLYQAALQVGKDNNTGMMQLVSPDGVNQMGIHMEPDGNGNALIEIAEDNATVSVKDIKKDGQSIIFETETGNKLVISSDLMKYKVGEIDTSKNNQIVANRVEGKENTIEFSTQPIEEEKVSQKENKSKEENEEPIQIIFQTKTLDKKDGGEKSQNENLTIKKFEDDIDKKVDEQDPSQVIMRFEDPPIDEKKEEENKEESKEQEKTSIKVTFNYKEVETACEIEDMTCFFRRSISNTHHRCINKKGKKKCKHTEVHQWNTGYRGVCSTCGEPHRNHTYQDRGEDCWCIVCGIVDNHYWRAAGEGWCRCSHCTKLVSHKWKNAKCEQCGMKHKKHRYASGKCIVCGQSQ